MTERDRASIGDVIGGRYVVERVLGEGGVGVVFAARRRDDGERVAIKIANASEGEAFASFKRNARAMSELRNMHTARVLDVGVSPTGLPWVATELLEGQDLAGIIETTGFLPIEDALRWTLQICEALAEAHDIGLIHRGLKPRNLFVTTERTIRVLDYGMSIGPPPLPAMSLDADPPTMPFGSSSSMVTGFITPGPSSIEPKTRPLPITVSPHQLEGLQYMAPELIRREEVDARTDVWAIGACLFRMLSGAHPFGGSAVEPVCRSILNDPPIELRALRTDVSASLDAVVKQCLRRAPRKRYQTMESLAAALRGVREEARETPVVIVAVDSAARASVREQPPATPIVALEPEDETVVRAELKSESRDEMTEVRPPRAREEPVPQTQLFPVRLAPVAMGTAARHPPIAPRKPFEEVVRRRDEDDDVPALATLARSAPPPTHAPATPLLAVPAPPPSAAPTTARAPDTVQDLPVLPGSAKAELEVPPIFAAPVVDKPKRASPEVFSFASAPPPANENVHRAELDWKPSAAVNVMPFSLATPSSADATAAPATYAQRPPSGRTASMGFALGLVALAFVSLGLLYSSSVKWPARLSGTSAPATTGTPSSSATASASAPASAAPPATSAAAPTSASSPPPAEHAPPPATVAPPPPPPPPATTPPPSPPPTPTRRPVRESRMPTTSDGDEPPRPSRSTSSSGGSSEEPSILGKRK